MNNQNVLAAIIAVFVSLILFIAGIIFSSDPFQGVSQDEFSSNRPVISDTTSEQSCRDLDGSAYQQCCDAWLEENALAKASCVGSWEQIDEAACSWTCSAE